MFFKNRNCEMSKHCLTIITATTCVIFYGGSVVCEYFGRDSIPLTLVGRNMQYISIALGGATFAYAGIHFFNFWNEHVEHNEDENNDEESSSIYPQVKV
jgi:hypothetical protein